eukprot:4476677-Amphidinium_carterae.1
MPLHECSAASCAEVRTNRNCWAIFRPAPSACHAMKVCCCSHGHHQSTRADLQQQCIRLMREVRVSRTA